MNGIICVELKNLFQKTKMYLWFYLWLLYHYIIFIKQIISLCTLPGTWMAKSFYILCTLKSCTCKITPNSSLWQSYPWIWSHYRKKEKKQWLMWSLISSSWRIIKIDERTIDWPSFLDLLSSLKILSQILGLYL